MWEFIARNIEKPVLILSFHIFYPKKNNYHLSIFFLIADLTSITLLNDTENYSNTHGHRYMYWRYMQLESFFGK